MTSTKVRVSLWLYGICVLRSMPIDPEHADHRADDWRRIYGEADIRREQA